MAMIAIASMTLAVSCGPTDTKGIDIDSMITAIPVQTEPGGRWGMMTVNGQLIFENEFVTPPTVAVNGLFSVSEDDALSMYAVGDQPKLIGQCEGLRHIGICNEGLVPVSSDSGHISIVGTDGVIRYKIGQINNKMITGCSRMFNDGQLVVCDSEGLYGCIDVNGKVSIKPKFKMLNDFSHGYAIAQLNDETASYAVVDRSGQVLTPVKRGYEVVSTVVRNNEFVIADSAGHQCIMDINGVVSKLPAKVKRVGDYDSDLVAYCADNGLWGLMSRDEGNAVLMRPKFKSLTILDGGDRFLVNLDDDWSIIDTKGKQSVVFGDTYLDVKVMSLKGAIRYFAKDNAGWTLMDDAGKEIHTLFNIYDVAFDATIGDKPMAAAVMTPQSLVDALIALVEPNGIWDMKLNTIANGWYRTQSPDGFANTTEFVPDSLPTLPKGCELSMIGVTDRIISAGIRFNSATQKVEYAFLPNNTINTIEIDVTSPIAGVYGKTKDALVAALEQKGYRLIDDAEDGVLMQSHYANLEIAPNDNDKTLTIIVYRL